MAHDIDSYDRVVGTLYDAALDAQRWPSALQAVADTLGCEMFHSFVWDLERHRPLVAWATETSSTSRMHEAYDRHYGRIDPRRRIVEGRPVGLVFRCHDHIDERAVGASEFYQDFLLPNGLRYMIGVTLAREPGREATLALLRAAGRPAFSDDEAAWARRLSPHLQRALALQLQRGQTAEQLHAGEQALDALETGVLLLDAAGAVAYANPVAVALLPRHFAPGPTLRRLTARSGEGARTLDAAWRRIEATGQPQSLRLTDADGSMAVTLCRRPSSPEEPKPTAGGYLVFLTPSVRQRLPDPRQLAALFDLTPAEARLARALAAGQTLAEFADATGVKRSTVRSQLLAVLAKTGTARQQELVALLARLPAP